MTQTWQRVLITGGAGFLGSHLCDRLLSRGAEVICLDSLITGRLENIDHLRGEPKFTFCQGDVTEAIDIDSSIDAVLHFASPASPPDYLEHPVLTLDVGTRGTRNALDLALRNDARFLLASTSEVYGDPLVHPQHESYWGNVNSVGPRSVYDEAKRAAEAYVMAYRRSHGLDTRMARIFNTYGPRMRRDDGRAVPQFVGQALAGAPLTIYGDGSQTRSLCFVDDLISGIELLLDGSYTEPVNLGNPEEVTINELAEVIQRVCRSDSSVTHRALPIDDPKRRCPEISTAGRELGWTPTISLAEGLRRTVAWWQRRDGLDEAPGELRPSLPGEART